MNPVTAQSEDGHVVWLYRYDDDEVVAVRRVVDE